MTVLLGVVGSTAYGLATETSDEDLLGVYLADAHRVCGLKGPAALTESRVTRAPDVTLHELYKFATLALKCNPTVSELLWLDAYKVATDEGRALIGIRDAFLSTPCVRSAYGGYAMQQSRKLLARHNAAEGSAANLPARTAKHARHCLRLLRQARGLLATGHLAIDMSGQRDELFAAGELAVRDPQAFGDLFTDEMAKLDSVESVLPDRPDADRVEALVIELRLASLRADLRAETTPR
jgi:hypothetical protein